MKLNQKTIKDKSLQALKSFPIKDSRGQAFSVFNLLIAAVVSLAILGLLITIISGIGGFGGTEPSDAAEETLGNAINNEYALKTEEASFTENANLISALALENSTTVMQDDIEFCVVDGLEDNTFSVKDSLIKYKGRSEFAATVFALCVADKTQLDDALEQVGLEECDASENYCVVGVKRN